ncbi:DUF389 domain-containing protein [Capillimicrobium parvum]|uniref:DUF389 domain-containing protein n=1 Tax=Capillimicrobium parvum TaxID=2884022 RepID=A0A9E6XYI9_9ACTN|nr:DUF389 domain-containing protein [Capillimicrobium parvum]UGS36293.1 hypothetical protein DSM104329_02697 [Capillimicrobium parvum]
MIHLRIVSPPNRTKEVLDLLGGDDAVCNVITLPGRAIKPTGDMILADVAREDASIVVSDLRHLGIEEHGSIAIEHIDTALGSNAAAAISSARGEEADAVVWEEVQTRTSEEASLSWTYLAFMMLAASIGACGLFTDNPILIVGAMVVSPDFGPIAGVCVGLVTRRGHLALRSMLAIVVGFAAASATAYVVAQALLVTGAADRDFNVDSSGLANLIASPDAFTFVVAFCAGAAGTLSLTTAKSGALIGVLISVTTIPAASDIGVSAATLDWHSAAGSAEQLIANIATIILAGTLTLLLQRLAYNRRRRAHDRARADDLASGSTPGTPRPRASSPRG